MLAVLSPVIVRSFGATSSSSSILIIISARFSSACGPHTSTNSRSSSRFSNSGEIQRSMMPMIAIDYLMSKHREIAQECDYHWLIPFSRKTPFFAKFLLDPVEESVGRLGNVPSSSDAWNRSRTLCLTVGHVIFQTIAGRPSTPGAS